MAGMGPARPVNPSEQSGAYALHWGQLAAEQDLHAQPEPAARIADGQRITPPAVPGEGMAFEVHRPHVGFRPGTSLHGPGAGGTALTPQLGCGPVLAAQQLA